MKTDFPDIVDVIVQQWRERERKLFEKGGLLGVSRRKQGDIAEDYIVRRIGTLPVNYHVVKSKGSQTPADIFALARRKDYWHIMMIQVKSSIKRDTIYKLNSADKKLFDSLGQLVGSFFDKPTYSSKHGAKPILITTGYAGVWRQEIANSVRHTLDATESYKLWNRNVSDEIVKDSMAALKLIHKL